MQLGWLGAVAADRAELAEYLQAVNVQRRVLVSAKHSMAERAIC
jgi:hypothetical protein